MSISKHVEKSRRRRERIQKLKKRNAIIKKTIYTLSVLFIGFICFIYIRNNNSLSQPVINLINTTNHSHQEFQTDSNANDNSIDKKTTELISKYPKLQNILENPTDYPFAEEIIKGYGLYPETTKAFENLNSYPESIISLLFNNPETLHFVANYNDNYPCNTDSSNISVKDDYTKGSIPHFLQWDERWGYYDYGADIIAIDGCGPTALAMVVVGLTGDTSVNPKNIADFSYKNKYATKEYGTSWTLISEGSLNYNVKPKELPLTPSIMINELKNNRPIIASMAPGDFTSFGHFIVLTAVNEDGHIIVHDPNNIARSKATWDVEVLAKQIKNLWSFTVVP